MPKGEGNTCMSPILLERANEMYHNIPHRVCASLDNLRPLGI